MSQEKIFELAKKFRAALEAYGPEPGSMWKTITERFPRGCCDDSSLMLAAFLADNGFPGALRVHGGYGGDEEELVSHVWLQLGDLIVDVTSDQFDRYGLPPVFVGVAGDFHNSFEMQDEVEPADFRIKFSNDSDWLLRFKAMYQDVKRHIPSRQKNAG